MIMIGSEEGSSVLGAADIFGVDFYDCLELLEKVFEDGVVCVAEP